MRDKCNILIADEPGIMRDGLCGLLAAEVDISIAGVVGDAVEALRALEQALADLLIVDPGPAPALGADAIAQAKRRWPGIKVLVLSFRKEDACIEVALRAGADGYLLKTDHRAELFAAIRTLDGGKPYLSPAVYERVVNGFVNPKGTPGSHKSPSQLTQREREVIRLIAAGQRTREIARQLSLSHKTIEKHRTNLMRKLGLKTATAVAAYAIANGYHTL